MAITRGNITTAAFDHSAQGTFTISHNSNGDVLSVFFGLGSAGTDYLSSITYNGVALVFVDSQANFDVDRMVTEYRLVAPAAGVNNLSYTTDTTNRRVTTIVRSLSGVDQTTPIRNTQKGAGHHLDTEPSEVVTTVAGDLVLDACFVQQAIDFAVGAGQTGDAAIDESVNTRMESSYEEASGASTTMTWDLTAISGGVRWTHIASSFQPVSTGAPFGVHAPYPGMYPFSRRR